MPDPLLFTLSNIYCAPSSVFFLPLTSTVYRLQFTVYCPQSTLKLACWGMSDKGVCRTAPATPGLLTSLYGVELLVGRGLYLELDLRCVEKVC